MGRKIPAASFGLQSLFRFDTEALFDLLLVDQNLDGVTVSNTNHFAGEHIGEHTSSATWSEVSKVGF